MSVHRSYRAYKQSMHFNKELERVCNDANSPVIVSHPDWLKSAKKRLNQWHRNWWS